MALIAYSKYRLRITESSSQTKSYVTINEFGLYEDSDHLGVNLCIGAVATASSSYQANTIAPNAIDGNPATYWESAAEAKPSWLRVDLPAPKIVRSFYLSTTTYPNEVPSSFVLQGSHDGTTWIDIAVFTKWTAAGVAKSAYERINIRVGGVSKIETGASTMRVMIHDWLTGNLVALVTPAMDGSWSLSPRDTRELLITHIGPSGYQPWSDGPVAPYLE